MSYLDIVRKCSVCENCGACDYEYETETGEFSGDYGPLPDAIIRQARERDRENRDRMEGLL